MDFERLNGDIKEMRRRNRGLGLAVGVLAAGQIPRPGGHPQLFGNGAHGGRAARPQPDLLGHPRDSHEYLEQMGSFIAWLILDVTPASIDWKKDVLSPRRA